ncbi:MULTISPECIES: MAPEG family protein [Halobacteriovorax]|uniref:Glutathione S-transferase n=1 Tax=Halobacteriovorax vibrionivorans TaxID=2152716 RepID=A0ABY0IE08_9BACT|nr:MULTISPECIES: MAPEG family protein [Halobacteriovorax]AYF44276.1 MAPEG family protein [Halobacteriovorax sp. BALOs_7]RZF21197.1 glutathione S-transferase [Halobacteriovorax vibrionivorans]TGD45667.1 glutathione S-transferase [Halobacteriovorax sp. Y22]
MELQIFYRYCGVLGLIYLLLTFYVIRMRWKHRVGLGHGKNEHMTKAVRIHGNYNEYVPFILMLTYFAIQKNAINLMAIHFLLGGLVLSRISHFIGLRKSAGSTIYRMFGTGVIIVALFAISITLLG